MSDHDKIELAIAFILSVGLLIDMAALRSRIDKLEDWKKKVEEKYPDARR